MQHPDSVLWDSKAERELTVKRLPGFSQRPELKRFESQAARRA